MAERRDRCHNVELLHPDERPSFIGVKELHMQRGLLEEFSRRALQVDEVRSEPGFLPDLQNILTICLHRLSMLGSPGPVFLRKASDHEPRQQDDIDIHRNPWLCRWCWGDYFLALLTNVVEGIAVRKPSKTQPCCETQKREKAEAREDIDMAE
ncbi:hypothetical protein EI94DRAFT_1710228 [Lactarius quietus]|nr:hypothetical protein EI94DRAFT_1710228 [Lactarius quietus]